MERAGHGDTDPDAERRGLSTPATRAAVIEKLVKGGLAERKDKQLIPDVYKRQAHTAQQTIPYIQMYPDGICKVTGRKYSKTVAFERCV